MTLNFISYTEGGSKVGILTRRLLKIFRLERVTIAYGKARVKTKILTQSRRSQKPIFELRSVYFPLLLTMSALSLFADEESTSPSSSPPQLVLESAIAGKNVLYPGQRTTLKYNYYYTGLIQLDKEELPLLDPADFIKIGEKEIKNNVVNGISIQEISQMVEAVKPGVYPLGPSMIEGYAYRENEQGQRVRISPKMTSKAPVVTITVLPFPDQDTPKSFNGAIGTGLEFKTALLNSPQIYLDDTFSLELTITGQQPLRVLPLPDICCQPGFSGFFRTGDLPPILSLNGNEIRAKVSLRPLIIDIHEIPPLSFSYFDPNLAKYITLQSKAIPIIVRPSKHLQEQKQTVTPQPAEKNYNAEKSHIESFVLNESDLKNLNFGSWWVLSILPIGLTLIYCLKRLNSQFRKTVNQSLPDSLNIFKRSLMSPKGSGAYFYGITYALKTALLEANMIKNIQIDTEELSDQGTIGQVKTFLSGLNEHHFSNKTKANYTSIEKEGANLLKNINKQAVPETLANSEKNFFSRYPLIWIIPGCLVIPIVIFLLAYPASKDKGQLKIAMDEYRIGEEAKTIAEKQTAFNRSLTNYLQLEDASLPSHGNGKLFVNIGNAYFQLQEYPQAKFYYTQAEVLKPGSADIKEALTAVDKKLGIAQNNVKTLFPVFLSLPERLQLFFTLSLIALILMAFMIKHPLTQIKHGLKIISCLIAILLVSFVYTQYFSPVEAILLHSANIKRDAGIQYANAGNGPLPAGTRVEVIDIVDDGSWVKIITSDGILGYVPNDKIRIIKG